MEKILINLFGELGNSFAGYEKYTFKPFWGHSIGYWILIGLCLVYITCMAITGVPPETLI